MRCIIVVGLLLACHGAPDADQVLNLPGWSGDLPTKHFSGFVERDTGTRTHYWLVESEGNPETDPLIIWFNGGPPCSALVGSFSEMGPFRINFGKEDTEDALKVNPGRWNQRASLLFYENPPGVGFTYNKNESGYDADDNSQASDNLDALLGFYGKFPEYLSRKLFIAGESYAGVYIPMLAQKIVEHNTESSNGMVVPLEGILVGNGATATGDWYEGYLTNLRINHLYAHGLFGEPLYASIQTECKNFTKGIITDKCAALVKLTTNETGVLNQYDIRESCLNGQAPNQLIYDSQSALVGSQVLDGAPPPAKEDPCDLGATKLINYLNRKDVQRAIHVTEATAAGGNFTDCGGSFGRAVTYTRIPQDETVGVYPALVGKMRILIFNGDQDNCIPYTQDQEWTSKMGLQETKGWHPWKFDDAVAGYATEYEKNFTFTTLKGAGHLCPLTQPARAFAMMDRFVQGKPL